MLNRALRISRELTRILTSDQDGQNWVITHGQFSVVITIGAEDNVFYRLLGAKCLKCRFKKGVSARWDVKGVNIKPDDWKGDIIFDSIDIKNGKARAVGNQGASDVVLLNTPSGLTFVETTGSGNMIFTTVFPLYKPGTHDYCAVMSRHMNLITAPLPSQYYGTCRVWE